MYYVRDEGELNLEVTLGGDPVAPNDSHYHYSAAKGEAASLASIEPDLPLALRSVTPDPLSSAFGCASDSERLTCERMQ